MITLRILLITAVTLFAFSGITCTTNMAGATTETTNGVTGMLRNSDTTPATNTVVALLPSNFNPIQCVAAAAEVTIDTTDSSGHYRFNRIAAGTYNILARNRGAATSFLTKDITVLRDSITAVADGTMNRSGSIVADFSQSSAASDGYTYIPGTDIIGQVANNGSMVLDGIPSGTINEIMFVSAMAETSNLLRTELFIVADSTITLERPLWKYSSRITLNSSPSGANVAETVTDFELLLRLDSSTFDFSQAQEKGNDLYFTTSGNKPLPHAIERWDPTAQRAEVWVLVDTVFGDDSLQSITMYWGNPVAIPSSTGASVFDKASGYLGVWHLSDSGKDASGNHSDATVSTPIEAEGLIGYCRKFSGNDSIRIPTLFGKPQVVTLSAWAKLDSMPPKALGAEVVSIGDGCLLRMDDRETDTIGVSGSYHLRNESSFFHVNSGEYLVKSGWHYCMVVFDHNTTSQHLYIDGVLSASTASSDTIDYTGIGTATLIGKHGNGKTSYNFIGSIDEVRIRSKVISGSRIKLEYMNQKPEDNLVVFEK